MSISRKSRNFSVALVIAIIATIIALVSSFVAFADEYTEGNYSYTVSDGEATITNYLVKKMISPIEIPSTLGGYPVTKIDDGAFDSCQYTRSIKIPATVKEIGKGAFSNCESLESVEIPNGVTKIGASAFAHCSKLKSVEIPDSVTTLGHSAFYNCYDLADVRLSSKLTKIEDRSFHYCSSLKSITIPDGVTEIGTQAFYWSGLNKVVLGDAVEKIGAVAFDSDGITFYTKGNAYLYQYAFENGIDIVVLADGVRSASHKVIDGKLVFTVVTSSGDYNRVKVASMDDPWGSLAVSNTYTVNSDGEYVWTIKTNLAAETADYVFDVRVTSTNKYTKERFPYRVEITPTVKYVSHEICEGKIEFTVVTGAGDYNRVKLALASDTKGYIAYSSSYTTNSNGDYVWKIRADAPVETTNYVFDIRSDETGKYLKDYYAYDVEVIPTVKSVSYEIINDKIVFTVTTLSGNYNRIKVTTADNLSGSLGVANSYTINQNGDYVWVIKAIAPTEATNYAFDLRSSETGKYNKEYYCYQCDCEVETTIKSVFCVDMGDSLEFTVITKSGDFNRLRCGLSTSTVNNIANSNSYKVNSDGYYVWTLKINKPSGDVTLYFDLRNTATNKFIKEFYIFNYTA